MDSIFAKRGSMARTNFGIVVQHCSTTMLSKMQPIWESGRECKRLADAGAPAVLAPAPAAVMLADARAPAVLLLYSVVMEVLRGLV